MSGEERPLRRTWQDTARLLEMSRISSVVLLSMRAAATPTTDGMPAVPPGGWEGQ